MYESYAYVAGMVMRDLTRTIHVNGFAGSDSIRLCPNSEAVLRIQPEIDSLTCIWMLDGQLLENDSMTLHLSFDSPGIYQVEVSIPELCDPFGTHIVVIPTDTVTTTFQTSICLGDSLLFNDTVITTPGTYTFVLPGITVCDSVILLDVALNYPSQQTEADTLCEGEAYLWRGRELATTGVYYDTLQGTNLCDSVIALNLTFLERATVHIDIETDCSTGTYRLAADLSEADGYPFRWNASPSDDALIGHEHDTLLRVLPFDTTCYRLILDHRCPLNDSVIIAPFDGVQAHLRVVPEQVTSDYPDFSAYDMSEGSHGRLWLLDNVESPFTGNPLVATMNLFEDSVNVGLVVWKTPVCRDTAHATVRLIRAELWAPNMFTPDTDINNRFAVVGIGIIQEELFIFNRWGLQVYHTDRPEEGWDGTYNGQPITQDAYVWMLKYRSDTSPQTVQTRVGTVTLLR